jgi:hypothetical protein
MSWHRKTPTEEIKMTIHHDLPNRIQNRSSNLTYEDLMERWPSMRPRALAEGGERFVRVWDYLEICLEQRRPAPILAISQLKRIPVDIEAFVEGEEFLGGRIQIWPALMADLMALNPDVLVGKAPVHEAFLGGATGTGKSTLAKITLLYQLYLLTCFRDPRVQFGLDPTTRIVFPLMSTSPDVTRRVLYEPLRDMFEAMPYTQKHLTWNRRITSSLEIDGGIYVVPLIANQEAILGQAVIGAILDEVNFMRIVKNSTRVAGPRGQGGYFDQAEEVYREITQRRQSRFLNPAISIGCNVVSSSTRYQGDFLDRRIQEVEEFGRQNVVVRQHKRYDVAPQTRYCGETFSLLVGGTRRRTQILEDDEAAPDGAQVEQVPIEYREEFRRDPERALQTILGIAVESITPFIGQREMIIDAFEAGDHLEQWVDLPDVTIEEDGFPRWLEEVIPRNPVAPRFIHIDLSHTGDACGIAIVRAMGLVNLTDPATTEAIETKPSFRVEAAISIQPSQRAALDFARLRRWLMSLCTEFGVQLHTVSFDSYESVEMRQAFRNSGINTRLTSVDRTIEPYTYLRECLYEGRIAIVESDTLLNELVALEWNQESNKVDHPPRGSKDVADAVCGAIWSAVRSRELRNGGGFIDDAGQPILTPRQRPQGRIRPPGRPRH